jgi:hypothetical protein
MQDPLDKAIEQIKVGKEAIGGNPTFIARQLNSAIETLESLKRVQRTIVSPPAENPSSPLDDMPGVRVVRRPPKTKDA